MPATMARQGGRVQLEQSEMRLAFNMAKMAKKGWLCAAIEETLFLIKKPRVEVQEVKKRVVEFPRHKNVKAAMERHAAKLRENQTDGCLPCHNGTVQNLQTCWWCKGTGAPPPERLRQPTPEPTPQPPKTPLVPPGNNDAAHLSEIKAVQPGSVYIHTPRPSALCLNHHAYPKDRKRDQDFDPDLQTDEETSTD